MPVDGEMLDHYKILGPLGKGGMGEVFLAEDTVLERKVAIKFLPEVSQLDGGLRKRFQLEAKAAAGLEHPYICKIYETGEIEGKAFIVMEYITGESLKEKLAGGPIPLLEALQLASGIAEAVEAAHEKGIVHRDLKPANIMLTSKGHPKIMDFGLAKQIVPLTDGAVVKTITAVEDLTASGAVIGTIAYMSPEQARGEPVDARSDIFSFGLVFYEMISGANPFQRPNQMDTLSTIIRDAAPPLQVQIRAASSKLRKISNKALAKDPAQRYQHIGDLAADIRKLRAELEKGSHLFRRWSVAAAAVLLMAILIVAGIKLLQTTAVKPTEAGIKPISLIVADVDNQSGDPAFDGVLEQLLSISLGGAEHISLFERKQGIDLIKRLDPAADGRLSEKSSRLICQREGIDLIVHASIEKNKGGFLIKAAAIDPASGRARASADQTIRAKSDVLKAADYLSAKLRAELGYISSESNQAIIKETFTTISLEAMKDYAEAQRLAALGREKEANQAYLSAIRNDPNFGRAYAGLAAAYYAQGEWQLADKYYKDALDRIEQMTDREKFRTRGGYFLFRHNYKKATEEYTALVRDHPKDLAGHTGLAFAYFMGYRMPEAFEEGLRALELDPNNLDYRYNQSWYALASGDFERARQEARKTLQINPSYAKALVVLALSELARGQPAEAIKQYEQLETMDKLGSSLSATGLADLALYEGRLGDAEAILKRGIDADLQNKSSYRAADKLLMLAASYAQQGKMAFAVQAADQAIRTQKGEDFLFAAALLYIEAGAEDKAKNIGGELLKKVQEAHQVYGKLIGGYLSLKRRDTANALKLFEEAQAMVDTWSGRFALGRAYIDAGAFAEACSEFEKCEKRNGEAMSVFLNDLPSYRYLDTLHYYIGRSQEGQGNRQAAKKSYEKFLAAKSTSAAPTTLVADVRRRLHSF
jgi:eukaryotic-like serine/threonine-protein kinase